MTEDEKFVREMWDGAVIDSSPQYGKEGNPHYWWIYLGGEEFLSGCDTEGEMWSTAARFTRQRLEEIRQIEEEIRFIDSFSVVAQTPQHEEARKRILAREQAALSELKKGMKQSGPTDSKGAY